MSGEIRLVCAVDRQAFRLSVDLALPGSGITALFGPSGSGKTTCLRLLAGLERLPGVLCSVGDQVWQDDQRGIFVPVHQRALGVVFQDASLFAHLSVRDNLLFGQRRVPPGQRRRQLGEVTALLGLETLLDRLPAALSGGERQRVAMGRALLAEPALLLMDEPLAALDWRRKQEILPYLERLHQELAIPMVYVSHAPDEVARLADHLVLLDGGQVIGQGALNTVLARTDLPPVFAEDPGVVLSVCIAEQADDGLTRLSFPGGDLWVAQRAQAIGTPLRCRIHARDVSLSRQPLVESSILNAVRANVLDFTPCTVPGQVLVRLTVDGTILLARITQRSIQRLQIQAGDTVYAQIKSVALLD